MTLPIPNAALDDRLAFVGTSGSGKTYAASTAVERLLARHARCVVVDPLGVWWGLRLMADGKTASPLNVVIFGGQHGDLPLNEHAGALIGETVATMAESCIVDLSGLATKSAERRFMLAFLDAIYRKTDARTVDPYHIVFDEADLWAPQKSSAPMLQSRMEEIVRRGRARGFIPWLITQRPAVLSKDVLSQADGLVALKLTGSHDRDALEGWVEGQADKQQWKGMRADLATFQRGQAIVWIPARAVLATVQFPEKATFDSSRTPKRGEKKRSADLKPLNIDALKGKLATIEAETKANDPRALKAEVARLGAELKKANSGIRQADPDLSTKLAEAEQRGKVLAVKALGKFARDLSNSIKAAKEKLDGADRLMDSYASFIETMESAMPKVLPRSTPVAQPVRAPRKDGVSAGSNPAGRANGHKSIEAPLQRIVDAIRWWNDFGIVEPSQVQVAFIAGYSHKSGTWSTYLGRLRSQQLIDGRGELRLTHAGDAIARTPAAHPTGEHLRAEVLRKIDGPLVRILIPLLESYPGKLSQAEVAEKAGYSHSSGTWSTYLGRMRSLDLIDGRGELKAQDWLFP